MDVQSLYLKHFVFTPDGCVAYAVMNCPGSWQDSAVCQLGELYNILDAQVPAGYFVIADSVFPVHGYEGAHQEASKKRHKNDVCSQLD